MPRRFGRSTVLRRSWLRWVVGQCPTRLPGPGSPAAAVVLAATNSVTSVPICGLKQQAYTTRATQIKTSPSPVQAEQLTDVSAHAQSVILVCDVAVVQETSAMAASITSVTAWGCEIMITCDPFDFGDVRAGVLSHGADQVGPGGLVVAGDHGPRRQALPGRDTGRLGERQFGHGALGGRHHRGLLGRQVGREGSPQLGRVDGELGRGVSPVSVG